MFEVCCLTGANTNTNKTLPFWDTAVWATIWERFGEGENPRKGLLNYPRRASDLISASQGRRDDLGRPGGKWDYGRGTALIPRSYIRT